MELAIKIDSFGGFMKTTYWHGDLAEYTGKSEMMYGGLFYEIRFVEGHRKGDTHWTQKEPK